MKSALKSLSYGAGLGLVLSGAGVFAAGGGDGTYLLCWLFSSPVGKLGFSGLVLGTPILWAFACYLASNSRMSWARLGLGLLLMIHYASVAVSLVNCPARDWNMLGVMLRNSIGILLVVLSIGLYLGLQAWLLHNLSRKTTNRKAENGGQGAT